MNCNASINFFRSMRKKGILSEEECIIIDTKLCKKFTVCPLLFEGLYAIIKMYKCAKNGGATDEEKQAGCACFEMGR
ncbi:MAG: hypothetical protein LUF89_01790, partial [Ruminococcus sp.]|nr:hypothetical protein [Ruminococcus sp.]